MATLLRRLRLWFHLAASLTATFVLLMLAAEALGSLQPPSAAFDGLHLSACALPCWMDVLPGTTGMQDAAQRLRTANLGGPMSAASDGRSLWGSLEAGGAQVYVQIQGDDEGIVRQITIIATLMDGIVFGDVISHLGAPACAKFSDSFALYSGDSAELWINAVGPQGERGIWAPLHSITIRPRFEGLDRCNRLLN